MGFGSLGFAVRRGSCGFGVKLAGETPSPGDRVCARLSFEGFNGLTGMTLEVLPSRSAGTAWVALGPKP